MLEPAMKFEQHTLRPIAPALHDADLSWIVGLVVYYALARPMTPASLQVQKECQL
jgi:hypothetical protein